MTQRCRKCQYRSTYTDTCDFLIITGRSRGCPVEACTHFAPRQREIVRTSHQPRTISRKQALRREQMQKLYDLGLSDGDIAGRVGVCKTTVFKWRHSVGLPPNTHLGGAAK